MTEPREPVERKQRLRHRLVGAVVLAALAAILVPTILDFRDEDSNVISRSNIPEKPAGFRVEEIQLAPAPEAGERLETDPAPADVAVDAAPPPTATAPPPRQELLQGWAVQVGSFSSEQNAAGLRDQLRGKGYSAFLDRVTIEGRQVVRVLVGPDARREHSERLRDRLAAETGLNGVVVGYN